MYYTKSETNKLLNGKHATVTGGASTITSSSLTANKALLSDASGKMAVSSVSNTELGCLSGVSSATQTQLDNLNTSIKAHNDIVKFVSGNGNVFFILLLSVVIYHPFSRHQTRVVLQQPLNIILYCLIKMLNVVLMRSKQTHYAVIV